MGLKMVCKLLHSVITDVLLNAPTFMVLWLQDEGQRHREFLPTHSVCALIILKSFQVAQNLPSLFQMMEDFSGLALPPLFGEHILEAELEPGGVELGPGEVI